MHSQSAFTSKALELTKGKPGKGPTTGNNGVGGHARLFDAFVRQRAHKNSFDRIQRHTMRQQRLAGACVHRRIFDINVKTILNPDRYSTSGIS